MNQRDNDKILKVLGSDLPESFRFDGYDFVDWDAPNPKGGFRDFSLLQGARVLRVWGKDRVLVLFAYDVPLSSWHKGRKEATNKENYRLLFLNNKNELVEFSPREIRQDWRKDNGKGDSAIVPNWVIEQWLHQEDARSFKGRGWVEDIAMKIQNLVRRWEGHYNGNLQRENGE